MSSIVSPKLLSRLSKEQFYASVLSLIILSLALLMLWLGHWLPENIAEKIVIREVSLALPPPPPPPPQVQQEAVEVQLSVQVQGAGAVIPKIDVKQKIDPIKPEAPAVSTPQSQWQPLKVDWDAVDLNQLDGLPSLLTPLRVNLPRSLSRKGIKRILVKLDVVIDTQGQVTLINIVENPYPELVAAIQSLVRNSRFTPPTKDKQAVRTRFIWPVDIKS